jgi:hypothetical protein
MLCHQQVVSSTVISNISFKFHQQQVVRIRLATTNMLATARPIYLVRGSPNQHRKRTSQLQQVVPNMLATARTNFFVGGSPNQCSNRAS